MIALRTKSSVECHFSRYVYIFYTPLLTLGDVNYTTLNFEGAGSGSGNWENKGQLISKCPFDVTVSTKIPTNFLRISALASKKRLTKNKSTFLFLII